MTLRNDLELENTKRKLQQLDELIEQSRRTSGPGRDAEIRSLSRLANELREEIIRYESALHRVKEAS